MSAQSQDQRDQFKSSLSALLTNAEEEYDLDVFELLSLSVEGLNQWMNEPVLEFTLDFEPDEDPDNTTD